MGGSLIIKNPDLQNVSALCLDGGILVITHQGRSLMSSDRGWLKRESERARSRTSSLPMQARPAVTGGSFASSGSVQAGRSRGPSSSSQAKQND